MAGTTILVVDDDPQLLAVVEAIIRCWGYEAALCASGAEALHYLNSHPLPHLAIIDVVMPDLDGAALAKMIRAVPQWKALPIVFVSGLERPPDIPHAAFIPKPFGAGELFAVLSEHCRPSSDPALTDLEIVPYGK
jgi:CheY-like chemotaxis protein